MFESFAALFPAEWRAAVLALTAPMRWLAEWQSMLMHQLWTAGSPAVIVALSVTVLIPALLIMAGTWCTVAAMYTLPFRSGRGRILTTFLMTWWDAGRCIWLFWTGMIRVVIALVGWVVGTLRFGLRLLKNLLLGIVRSPLTMFAWTSRAYFKPGMPWIAFLVLVVWSGVEATIFTFTLQPTLNEVFGGLTGFEPNPRVMAPLLWFFLFMLVAGSFACVQALTEAVENRKVGAIVQMVIVESAVMFFEVIFLYRELIDAITPWIAQQSGGQLQLGIFSTLALASFGWMGVRGMSWFLFGRFGTPALMAILSRQTIDHEGSATVTYAAEPELWRAPIEALKAETAWFHEEAKRMFTLLSLPVLQLFAAALNFAVVLVQSRPMFTLPFRSLDDILVDTPSAQGARDGRPERLGWKRGKSGAGMPTPRDPMPRVA